MNIYLFLLIHQQVRLFEYTRQATNKADIEQITMAPMGGKVDRLSQSVGYSQINLEQKSNNYLHGYPEAAPFMNGGAYFKDLDARVAMEKMTKVQFIINWMMVVNKSLPASTAASYYGDAIGDNLL